MNGILVILNRPEHAPGLLAAAAEILHRVGGARLDVLAAREPPQDTILPTENILTEQRTTELRDAQRGWANDLHTRFRAWLSAARADGQVSPSVEANWLDPEISVGRIIAGYAGDAALIVIGFPQPHDSDQKRRATHAALFDSGRPVLFVPPGWNRPVGARILLAWKDTEPCRRAFASAGAVLRQAEHLALLRQSDTPPPAGLPPTCAPLPGQARTAPPASPIDAAEQILATAHDDGCDLIVMGAFAHGRLHDRLLGSVTTHILDRPDIPTWMQH
ncbi:universal stress protein [Gluconacetobacter azotocaptans]|uniref:Universal stress protein n=1 Tax=Gluconacetobacter azotocaptans TaxID=142834 RepID=A0A7W4JUQ4_9PROT|nr:universal stress protein [Gluconacetobacter azotocaptans]MBB2191267.1 universal stress protein [Gluconacetobacter azotocaptans]MBM9402052.1 universal stress protein [Gluconacetobacter azotocaptans]GBQ25737.1 UspA domain-containing protein [Gluconacetobacter azotocaptans DSM 13594]